MALVATWMVDCLAGTEAPGEKDEAECQGDERQPWADVGIERGSRTHHRQDGSDEGNQSEHGGHGIESVGVHGHPPMVVLVVRDAVVDGGVMSGTVGLTPDGATVTVGASGTIVVDGATVGPADENWYRSSSRSYSAPHGVAVSLHDAELAQTGGDNREILCSIAPVADHHRVVGGDQGFAVGEHDPPVVGDADAVVDLYADGVFEEELVEWALAQQALTGDVTVVVLVRRGLHVADLRGGRR